MHDLESEQFDVVAAFLYGELEEEIYMKMPKGYVKYLNKKGVTKYNETDYCLTLRKSIYGLVQAARQWWKRFKTVLENIGFKACQSDCCLFVRVEQDKRLTIILLYVDDGVIFGTRKIMDVVLDQISKEFEIKRMGPMKKYLGFELDLLKTTKEIFITQPKSTTSQVRAVLKPKTFVACMRSRCCCCFELARGTQSAVNHLASRQNVK